MKPDINKTDTCYVCGAKEVATSSSLHVWMITYNCGCKIWGAFGSKEVQLETKCSYDTE